MNAAAKVIQQSSLFHGQWALQMPKVLLIQLFLLIFVLSSALSVVYLINLHRVTCSHIQTAEQHTHQLELQWGQLLLEQASLVTPARVEKVATEKLHMVYPSRDKTFVLRAE